MALHPVDATVHAQRQAKSGPVDVGNDFVQIPRVVAHHVQHRAEDLVLQLSDRIDLIRHRGKKVALQRVIQRRPGDQAGVPVHALCMLKQLLPGMLTDDRTYVRRQPAWIPQNHLTHGAGKHFKHLVRDIGLQVEHTQCGTALSRAVKSAGNDVLDDLLR